MSGVKRIKLGSQGLEVSAIGLGCMGMSGGYGPPKPEEEMIKVIHHAFNSGIIHFDTSDVYGPLTNEILLGKALKGIDREKVQVATKFGIKFGATFFDAEVHGEPEYVRAACEASLKRLDIDYIDLYYAHRIDTKIPIEITMGELKKLVEEGKIKYIGLSEACAATIRRAHAVHPITAVQLEWSLWTRDAEDEVIPTCRELGIGIVPFAPLGSGFLASGPKLMDNIADNDFRKIMPRFQGENFEHNKVAFERVSQMAERKGCTLSQLALAWVLHQGDDVGPIPGTTKIENLNQNLGALTVKLKPEEMAELESVASFKGARMPEQVLVHSYKNSDTPPLSSWKSENKKGFNLIYTKMAKVPRIKLGSQGLEVSAQGLGCMGMSAVYGPPKPEPEMIKLIHHAIDAGVTLLDTSDVYGPETNEILLGKVALKGGVREKTELATKFGINYENGNYVVHGDPAYVRAACEASLKRLGIDCIDLYYQHRIDTRVPIEITMGEIKKLVEEGKIKYVGLSEASASTIRRAHAVHPITAVQLEWSLWSRDVEEEIIPTCRFVTHLLIYSKIVLTTNLWRNYFSLPRFQPENLEHNKALFERVSGIATKKGCTPSQLALAWVHHQGTDVVPIPGTTKIENLQQNIGALSVKLTPKDMEELESIASDDATKGERYMDGFPTYLKSDTPPLSSWKA
ncbi:hypothetical protein OSB04_010483 [Centaurea solstitialis]|uniref:NADP-dependent oxidoreductase domain-containing protein n=1 Tax=Centaurea solstitialis TaxID=347529 RepID=A0AA38T7N9_9ASTR|nr:hypothetical protein OSB04_010483 [Centaurea solstitialis]